MALLTFENVRLISEVEGYDWPMGEDIVAGQYARLDPTTGMAMLGNATLAAEIGNLGGMVTGVNNRTVHVTLDGLVHVGDTALDGLNYDALVYLSDTDGTSADAQGTILQTIASVVPVFNGPSADKILHVTGVKLS